MEVLVAVEKIFELLFMDDVFGTDELDVRALAIEVVADTELGVNKTVVLVRAISGEAHTYLRSKAGNADSISL